MSQDLSLENRAREKAFQDHIIEQLAASGWLVGESSRYDKERALYPEDVIAYVQESQPEGWQKYCKTYGEEPERHLLNAVARSLESDERGTLWLLRHQVEDRGHRLAVAPSSPTMTLTQSWSSDMPRTGCGWCQSWFTAPMAMRADSI